MALSERQQEVLEWLDGGWELLRWRCTDGTPRWHVGDEPVDGRAVRGLERRRLLARVDTDAVAQMVLTDLGRAAVRCSACHHVWSDQRPGSGCTDIGGWDGHGWTGCGCNLKPGRAASREEE